MRLSSVFVSTIRPTPIALLVADVVPDGAILFEVEALGAGVIWRSCTCHGIPRGEGRVDVFDETPLVIRWARAED